MIFAKNHIYLSAKVWLNESSLLKKKKKLTPLCVFVAIMYGNKKKICIS